MTLEEFILTHDLWYAPLQSSLLYQLQGIITENLKENEDERCNPIVSLQDLTEYADNERELADCDTIWKQFESCRT
jgi:hypothetical protein